MKISKFIGILLLCMSFLAISGCMKNDNNKETTDEVQLEEESSKIPELVSIKGWKTLQTEAVLNQLGENSSSIEPFPTNATVKNKTIKYSIDYPESWTLDTSVFCDANNKKIAEISPTVLLKPGQESMFLDYKPMTDFGEELILKEAIQFKSYKGTKIITKIPTENGSWYPHKYRISDGTYGYTITFYSGEINNEDQELFNKIINTFRFDL